MLNNEKPSITYRLIDELGNNRLYNNIYKQYIQSLGLNGRERVLDFGCGSGAGSKNLARLLQNDGELTCIDISRYWMKKAHGRMKKYSCVKYLTGNIFDFKLSSDYFDAVYIFYALHEVDAEIQQKIAEEFFRILRPGGRLYIKEPERQSDGMPGGKIKSIMCGAGFTELSSVEKNQTFRAVYLCEKSQRKA